MSNPNSPEDKVRARNFRHVYTWTDSPNTHYPPHSHTTATTHLILSGEMTICFLEETPGVKKRFGVGTSVDVARGQVHEVWIGAEGCEYVVGE